MPDRSTDEGWAIVAHEIGSRIRQRRVDLGRTQEDVAHAAGISRSHLQLLERGLSRPGLPANPTIRSLTDIAAVLETDLESLLPQVR